MAGLDQGELLRFVDACLTTTLKTVDSQFTGSEGFSRVSNGSHEYWGSFTVFSR